MLPALRLPPTYCFYSHQPVTYLLLLQPLFSQPTIPYLTSTCHLPPTYCFCSPQGWGFTPKCLMDDNERYKECARLTVTCRSCVLSGQPEVRYRYDAILSIRWVSDVMQYDSIQCDEMWNTDRHWYILSLITYFLICLLSPSLSPMRAEPKANYLSKHYSISSRYSRISVKLNLLAFSAD